MPWGGKKSVRHVNIDSRVDALAMRQLKIDQFIMMALKLQAVSHNTTRLITIGAS